MNFFKTNLATFLLILYIIHCVTAGMIIIKKINFFQKTLKIFSKKLDFSNVKKILVTLVSSSHKLKSKLKKNLKHAKYVITSGLKPKSSESDPLSNEGGTGEDSFTDSANDLTGSSGVEEIENYLQEIVYLAVKIFDILEQSPGDSESENESNDDSEFTDSEIGSGIDSQSVPEMDSEPNSETFTEENPGGKPESPSETKPENDFPKKNKRNNLKNIGQKLSKNLLKLFFFQFLIRQNSIKNREFMPENRVEKSLRKELLVINLFFDFLRDKV